VTVERARDWGCREPQPSGLIAVPDDAAASRLVGEAWASGAPLPPVGLLGGDLRRTLGGGERVERLGAEVAVFCIDVGLVDLGGREWPFVSHVVARRRWWSGELLAVMNAEFLGRWDVAPRSHPNDGRLDVIHAVDLRVGDRWKAWRRLPTGTHVPHPRLAVQRTAAARIALQRRRPVRVDGVVVGSFAEIAVRVEPDALTVCI
jgi:hypothetical protein